MENTFKVSVAEETEPITCGIYAPIAKILVEAMPIQVPNYFTVRTPTYVTRSSNQAT